MLQIQPMIRDYAKAICGWRYEGIYSLYDFDDGALPELLNGEYYSCTKEGELIGFFCFGASARIPTVESGVYQDGTLDFGLGLKPELCGKGWGRSFVRAGMRFSEAPVLRLSVAAFNRRAIHLYTALGFSTIKQVHHLYSKTPFAVMTAATGLR